VRACVRIVNKNLCIAIGGSIGEHPKIKSTSIYFVLYQFTQITVSVTIIN